MIRDKIKNKIFSVLETDVFRFEDFEITEKNSNEYILQILLDEKYLFRIKLSRHWDYCKVDCRPGVVLQESSLQIPLHNFEYDIVSELTEWIIRIKTDMLNPLQQRFLDAELNKFKKQIEDQIKDVEDTYFTREEAETLKECLDKLKSQISEQDSTNDNLKEEILKMKREIEFLKDSVELLTKKKWLQKILIKLWSWSQKPENKALIGMGMETVKQISQIDFPDI